jgi:glycosyltransferase involved in cell wall biosynthesis
MSPNYRYSILIPAYNGEAFLREALYSAVRQTRKADEIIVVDDGSTDNTAALAQSSEFRKEVQYYYHKKVDGFVDAWNQAIQKATGDFIILLHQDDLLYSDYVSVIDKSSQRYPNVRHFYASCNYIDETGKITQMASGPYSPEPVLYSGRQYAHNYLKGVVQNRHIHRCPGVTTSRELLLKECSYRKEAGHIADDDFFLRVGEFTDVVGISQPLAGYRLHPVSTTNKLASLTLKLAEAYLFQVHHYQMLPAFLDANDICSIDKLAVKFTNLLLFQGLTTGQTEFVRKALLLGRELDKVIPSFMTAHLSGWAKIMWTLASKKTVLAENYARSLSGGIRARDWLKKRLKRV